MFNTYIFNTQQFNASMPVSSDVVDGLIVYWNYALHDTVDVYARVSNTDDADSVDMDIYSNPLDDWQTLSSYYVRGKTITIAGSIRKDNAEDLNNEIDTMKSHLFVPWKKLSIKVNGEVRETTAYCSWVTFDRQHYNITYVRYSVNFTLTSEVRETKKYEATTVASVSSTLVEELINYWKFKAKPVIIFTMNSATSVTSLAITLWWSTITLSETLATNDIVEINREDQTVTINGDPVDYTWVIPTLEQWRNSYTVTLNGTYNYDVTIKYKKTFI